MRDIVQFASSVQFHSLCLLFSNNTVEGLNENEKACFVSSDYLQLISLELKKRKTDIFLKSLYIYFLKLKFSEKLFQCKRCKKQLCLYVLKRFQIFRVARFLRAMHFISYFVPFVQPRSQGLSSSLPWTAPRKGRRETLGTRLPFVSRGLHDTAVKRLSMRENRRLHRSIRKGCEDGCILL